MAIMINVIEVEVIGWKMSYIAVVNIMSNTE